QAKEQVSKVEWKSQNNKFVWTSEWTRASKRKLTSNDESEARTSEQ
ncbi:3164_t:CDS:1, partial [Ambispora leptoticha]